MNKIFKIFFVVGFVLGLAACSTTKHEPAPAAPEPVAAPEPAAAPEPEPEPVAPPVVPEPKPDRG